VYRAAGATVLLLALKVKLLKFMLWGLIKYRKWHSIVYTKGYNDDK
jgi:hypothetical protein